MGRFCPRGILSVCFFVRGGGGARGDFVQGDVKDVHSSFPRQRPPPGRGGHYLLKVKDFSTQNHNIIYDI